MAKARLTIIEDPNVGVLIEASGDYEPGSGGFAEELLMKAVALVTNIMEAREDMSKPQLIAGEKESIRQAYGEDAAAKIGVPPPAPTKIEPGTILRFPQP